MQKVKLNQLCTMQSGGTPSRSKAEYYHGTIPWSKISDLEKSNDGYIYKTEEHITDLGLKSINNRLFKKGTLLLAMYGSVGKTAIAKIDLSTNQAILGINIKDKNQLDIKYLKYWFTTIKEQLLNRAVGAALANISLGIVKELEIPLPNLATQQKIASILDKADELRQYNKQLIEKYEALTQSLFLDMFGDIVSNSMGWDSKTLKEISIRFSDGPFGSNLKTEHYSESGIQVIRLQNIGINKFNDNDNDKSFVNETHYNNVLKKYSCYPNDIVIATMGNPNIRACVVPNNVTVAVNKADCVLLRVNSNIANQIYISNLLNLEAFLNLAISFIHGQTRSRISSGQLAKILVPIPPIDIQNQFAERVAVIEAQKQQAQEALAKSEVLFQGLLQQAFSGGLN